jgi:hypothetical protein
MWTSSLDLAQLYQFTPGEYSLTVSLPVNSDDRKQAFDITVKDIPFRITE